MAKNNDQKSVNVWVIAGALVAACVVIGSGIGELVGNTGAWSTIGVGVGIAASAILLAVRK